MESEAGPAGSGSRGLTLLDYAWVIWRYKILAIAVIGVSVLVTFVMTVRQPRIYEAMASVVVPKEGIGGGFAASVAASGVLQQIPGFSLGSLTPNRDLLVGLLKSRTLAQRVVDRFRLLERYQSKYPQDATATLQGSTSVTVSREGLILFTVEETAPDLGAQIANFYLEELGRLVQQLGSGEASRQRVFIADQLAAAKRELEKTEDALRRFQERNQAIILQDQTRGAIEAAGRLKGEIVASEVQLQVIRSFATESNPEVISLKRRIAEMKRQLAQVQYGEEVVAGRAVGRGLRGEISVPFARVPELSVELARRTRDTKTHETVVAMLTQQLEQAKIAEAKDLPVFHVLDPAIPAVRPSKPSLRLNLLIAGVGSLLVGVFLIFVIENLRQFSGRQR